VEWGTQSVVITASPPNLERVREIVQKLDVGTGQQQVREIYKLEQARAVDVGNIVNQHLRDTRVRSRRGKMPVSVVANENTNSLILSGPQEEVEQIKNLVVELDVPPVAETGRFLKVYRVKYANLWSVWNAINQSFNTGRGIKEQDRVNAGLDWDTGTIMVTASKDRHEEITTMLEDIDKESQSTRTFQIVELANGDASEIAKALSQIIKGKRTQRGQTKPSVTANASTNSLIVYASEKEMGEFQPLIDSMDAEDAVGTKPQRIKVEHQSSAQLADLLTRIFTDAAKQQGRGRGGDQRQIPIIMSDDASNSLIVRAQEKDFNEISEMVTELDIPDADGPSNVRIIQVAQGVDVSDLSRTIEDTIRQGERFKKQANKSYKPAFVAIGADVRTNSLIVAGSSSQFEEVEKLVRTLEKMKPTGPTSIRVVNIKNIKSSELKKVLDQMLEQRQQSNNRSRRRR